MLSTELDHRSLWQETASGISCPRLEKGLHVDVAIVGGGITGLTAAVLLKRAGQRVAVLEAHTIGGENSLRTTAHLTEAIDARYATIEKKFGLTAAQEVAFSSHVALARIRGFVRELNIDCVYRTVPGFLYTEREDDLRDLHLEYEAAARAGVHVDMVRDVPLPFRCAAAVRFPDQAQVHAARYLEGLAQAIPGDGCHVFEHTLVRDVEEGEPCALHVANGLDEGAPEQRVTCDRVIFGTSAPPTRFALQTKLAHYRSYAIARVDSGDVPLALFWDTDDPYHYTRTAEIFGKRYLVIGGEDHKTGQRGNSEDSWTRLEEYARARFGPAPVTHRWSGQILEPVDGLPYIGKIPGKDRLSIGVGYSGNGMTFGTLAGMLLAEPESARAKALLQLYSPSRMTPLASAKDFVTENVDFPAHFLGDRLRAPDARSVEDVERGEGKIVKLGGERLAVYRDDGGALHTFSPVCPHLGCHVAFNNAERSWDCPCHGSRFDTEGRVLHGPATRGLTAKKA